MAKTENNKRGDMTELDFDELDRAVNSVMTGSSAPQPVSVPQRTGNSLRFSSELNPATTQAADARSSSIVSRRRGQFMDMKPTANYPKKTTGVVPPRPTATSIISPSPKQSTVGNSDVDNTTDALTGSDLGASPFLPDAKVEKRPLGLPVIEPLPSSDQAEEEAVPTVTNIDRIPANEPSPTAEEKKDSFEVPLPAELQSDLLNIESNTPHMAEPVSQEIVAPQQEAIVQSEQPDSAIEQSSVVASIEEASSDNAAIESTASPVPPSPQPVAIKQQYQVSVTETAEHASVFDIEPPIIAKPKKKNGWLIALGIVGLAMVSVGAGIGVFILTNGMN